MPKMAGTHGKSGSSTKVAPSGAAILAPVASATPPPAKGQTTAPPTATPAPGPPAAPKRRKPNMQHKGATLKERGELKVKADLCQAAATKKNHTPKLEPGDKDPKNRGSEGVKPGTNGQ